MSVTYPDNIDVMIRVILDIMHRNKIGCQSYVTGSRFEFNTHLKNMNPKSNLCGRAAHAICGYDQNKNVLFIEIDDDAPNYTKCRRTALVARAHSGEPYDWIEWAWTWDLCDPESIDNFEEFLKSRRNDEWDEYPNNNG